MKVDITVVRGKGRQSRPLGMTVQDFKQVCRLLEMKAFPREGFPWHESLKRLFSALCWSLSRLDPFQSLMMFYDPNVIHGVGRRERERGREKRGTSISQFSHSYTRPQGLRPLCDLRETRQHKFWTLHFCPGGERVSSPARLVHSDPRVRQYCPGHGASLRRVLNFHKFSIRRQTSRGEWRKSDD